MSRDFKCRYKLQSVREEDVLTPFKMGPDDDHGPPDITLNVEDADGMVGDGDSDGDRRPSVGNNFLNVDLQNAEANSNTYVYRPDKSFQGMTIDALPDENNYRDIRNIQAGAPARPTVEELKSGQLKPKEVDVEDGDPMEKEKKGKVVKFGWIEGVYMRCLLNIWGVMLFLRLTTVIGQCGILQGLLVILLCNIVTAITAVSMSAVSTNGMIKGGGIYYMISRSLGPEFGGAIGVMFTVANSIAVATYVIGFCDAIIDMVAEYKDDFDGIVGTLEERENDIRIIGSATCVAILILAIVGMDWVTRVQIGLLVLLLVSQVDFIIGSFIVDDDERKYGFTGYDIDVFTDNLAETHYHPEPGEEEDPDFFYWFGVFFPAVTGIVAGANLSGDLKDPSTAIPQGTLLAIATTFVTYMTYGAMIGGCYLPEASGDQQEYNAYVAQNKTLYNVTYYYNECEPQRECLYGSSNDQQTMSKISFTGYLVYAGCFAATLSSAIASLVGAPRVLQALAKDKLYPGLYFFAKGYTANNDPYRGYILVFIISVGMTLVANLDAVSTLLSNFFVAAYALINFSVFHASITKQSGWRPAFKYYNLWVSLLGTFLCVFVMFALDWLTAIITLVCVIILYMYIAYTKPEANWGSSTQGQQFVSALRSVQTLSETQEHVKNYRPKVIVFTGIPAHRLQLIDFANLMTKKSSLLIAAHVAKDIPASSFEALKTSVNMWMQDHAIRGFYSISPAEKFDEGAISQLSLAGLGRLSPNMVLMGFKSSWIKDAEGTLEYFNVLNEAIDQHLSVAILRVQGGLDYSDVIAQEEQIGVEAVVADDDDKKGESNNNKSRRARKKANKNLVIYQGVDGRPLPKETIARVTQFQGKHNGSIDVWWLYDDGGLTLLLPYILTTRSQYAGCQLRVFSLANRADELAKETRNMASLLAKFRIDFSDVTVIPDITKKAREETKDEYQEIVSASDQIDNAELLAQKERTNRHLRLAELLRENSRGSEMVIMTLPMPRKGTQSAALYMSWLEIMTRGMPPFVLIRGNQQSVLTYYS